MEYIMIHKKRFLFYFSFSFFLFFALILLFGKVSLFDQIVYDFIMKFKSSEMTNFLKLITYLGNIGVVFLIILLLFLCFPSKPYGKFMIINTLLVGGSNLILKNLFMRPRPSYQLIEVWGYSFPSGHAMTSFAIYGLLAYFIYKKGKGNKKWIFLGILLLIITFIGISRIYLGVHYASDVCAGFALGISYLMIYIHYYVEPHMPKCT